MENPFKFGSNHSHTYLRGAQRLLSFFNPSYVALLTPLPFTFYPFIPLQLTTHIQLAPFFTSTLK